MRLMILLWALLSIAGVAAADEAMPDTSRWNCEGTIKLFCSDGNPDAARNFVLEYRNPEDNSPYLRIWGVLERSPNGVITSVACRYYKKKGDAWQLLEKRSFRRSRATENKPVLLFMKNSPFGKEFFAYAKELGGDISVPVLEFEK